MLLFEPLSVSEIQCCRIVHSFSESVDEMKAIESYSTIL